MDKFYDIHPSFYHEDGYCVVVAELEFLRRLCVPECYPLVYMDKFYDIHPSFSRKDGYCVVVAELECLRRLCVPECYLLVYMDCLSLVLRLC